MYMQRLTASVENNFDSPVAATRQGLLRGTRVEGTYIFRGVKYAEGERFHKPVEPSPWEGVKRAENQAPVCPDFNVPLGPDAYRVPCRFYPESEDCRYLNIWSQSLDRSARRPVMVWIAGDGWTSGHSAERVACDGENLSANQDVVVVFIEHRLHILGFLDLSAYGAEYAESATLGIADLVAALRWIQENIESFGGDPGNITLFGQSGGAEKIVSLMQTAAADGLYHKVILQSGGFSGSGESCEERRLNGQRYTALVLERLGLTPGRVKEIETAGWYDLATAAAEALWIYQQKYGKKFQIGPVPDQNCLGHPLDAGFRVQTRSIPMMIGHCFGEHCNNYDHPVGGGQKNSWSEAERMRMIRQYTGNGAGEYVKLFQQAYPEKNPADILFFSSRMRRDAVAFCQKRVREADAPVWNWIFTLEAPFMNGTTPWSHAEEPYVFRNAAYMEAQYEPGVSEAVEDMVSGAWAAFAKSGNPNHAGIPPWEPVTREHIPTMLFDRTSRVGLDHDTRLLQVYMPHEPALPASGDQAACDGLPPRCSGGSL